MVVEHHPVVPHHDPVGCVPQDDDLQLEDGGVGRAGDAVLRRKMGFRGEVEEEVEMEVEEELRRREMWRRS